MWPEDVDLLHRIWLRLSDYPGLGAKLHHRDVVGLALRRLDQELETHDTGQIAEAIERDLHRTE